MEAPSCGVPLTKEAGGATEVSVVQIAPVIAIAAA